MTDTSSVEASRGEVRTFEGALNGEGLRFSLVLSRFNPLVTEELLEGAIAALVEHGAAREHLEVVRVPGAFELPGACARLLDRGGTDGIVALGCVIRGETPHFEFVAGEAARGIGALAVQGATGVNGGPPVPVIFGVLTTDDLEQAMRRAGGGKENKGREAALAALEMARLYRALG